MSVETHMRINLRQIAERLSMTETALARSVSASLPAHMGGNRVGSMSAAAIMGGGSQQPFESANAAPGNALDGGYGRDSSMSTEGGPTAPLLRSGAIPVQQPNHRSPAGYSSVQAAGSYNAVGSRGASMPRPKASAPIAIRKGDDDTYGATRDGDNAFLAVPSTYSGQAMGGMSMPRAGTTPGGARVLVGSMTAANLAASGSFVPAGSSVAAIRRFATREAAVSSLDPRGFMGDSPGQLRGQSSNTYARGDEDDAEDLDDDDRGRGGGGGGGQDLLVSTNANGQVEISFIPRAESPGGLSRAESRLSRTESKLQRAESRLDRSPAAAADGAPSEKKPKKKVHFPTEPISQVTIFQMQENVVLEVKYQRPSWCLVLGAIANILRGLVWTLVCQVLYNKVKLTGPEYTTDLPARVSDDVRENVAIATRIGFEIYAGCAVLFAIIMVIFWRPSARDLKNLRSRKEQRKLAICIVSGALSRAMHAVSLGLAINATYVGLHHALPYIWFLLKRSRRKSKPMAYQDLLAGAALCLSIAVLTAGDMLEHIETWEVHLKWAALPVIVTSSVLRAVQRHRTKSLKAHFSHRLTLLLTMIADALVMLVTALAADYNVLSRIASATTSEIVNASIAICAMTVAVISDVLLNQFFDVLSGLSLLTLALPAAAAFFKTFNIGAPDVSFIMVSAVFSILSVIAALGSGEVNRKTKSMVLAADDGTGNR